MRAPISWLADYVDLDLPVDELARRLTMIGLKVEGIERPGAGWKDIVVGEVVKLEPHPTSNKPLWVAEVDLGRERITVVTAAPNVTLHAKAPAVKVGGMIPHGPDGGPMIIRAKPLAGIPSEGMLCSQAELGVSDDHSGIWILPPDTPVGRPLADIMGDEVLDIETNPNRPDTLSVIGIAREVAAMTRQQVSLPDLSALGDIEWLDEESIPVDVEDLDLCPRYTALRLEGVGGGTTPAWMASRLEAAGVRPISLLVDLTNYVMLEYGQPMHAFDARRLRGNRIIVRRAREGERMHTLDGVDRRLSPENLVIADAEGPVAIAGVMGGKNSEIADDTDTVILESATFDPISVRRTAKAMSLRTESSARFEKGLPLELTVLGSWRFVQLLTQILEKRVKVARMTDVSTGALEQRRVAMPIRDLHRLTGLPIYAEDAAEALSLLGFGAVIQDSTILAEVPFWRRVDIEQSADLVEEVLRMVGYDALPSTLPRRTMAPPPPVSELKWEQIVGDRLLASGVSEAVTHSLTSPEAMARLALREPSADELQSQEFWACLVPNPAGVSAREAETRPVRILNPATRDRQIVRLTLLPSLLDVVSRNLKHTDERVAFFEIARTIFPRPAELAYERRTLALALAGNRLPHTWQQPSPGPYTVFDMKGLIEAILDALTIRDARVQPQSHPALHPGRSAVLRLAGRDAAFFGELHPDVAARFDIENVPVLVAEVDLDVLFEQATEVRLFRSLPRYPAAYRDIAVVVDEATPSDAVTRVIAVAGGETLEAHRLFDVYSGPSLPAGKKSLAIGLTFRAPGATLTQEEVGEVMARIVRALDTELRATIRE